MGQVEQPRYVPTLSRWVDRQSTLPAHHSALLRIADKRGQKVEQHCRSLLVAEVPAVWQHSQAGCGGAQPRRNPGQGGGWARDEDLHLDRAEAHVSWQKCRCPTQPNRTC